MLPLKHHTLLCFFLFPSFMGLFFLGFHISVGEKTSNETDKGLSILPTEEIILQKHLAGSVALTTLKNT